jgi:hypothetical protein
MAVTDDQQMRSDGGLNESVRDAAGSKSARLCGEMYAAATGRLCRSA